MRTTPEARELREMAESYANIWHKLIQIPGLDAILAPLGARPVGVTIKCPTLEAFRMAVGSYWRVQDQIVGRPVENRLVATIRRSSPFTGDNLNITDIEVVQRRPYHDDNTGPDYLIMLLAAHDDLAAICSRLKSLTAERSELPQLDPRLGGSGNFRRLTLRYRTGGATYEFKLTACEPMAAAVHAVR